MSLRKIAVQQEEASRPDSARSTGSTGSKRVTFREEPQVHHVPSLKAHNRAPSPIPSLEPIPGSGRGRGKRGSPLRTGGAIRVNRAERKKQAADRRTGGGSKRNIRRVNVAGGKSESKYLGSGVGVGDGGRRGGGSSRQGDRGRGRDRGGAGGGESRRAKARAKQRAPRPGRNPLAVCCARMGVGSKPIKLNAAARQAVNYLHLSNKHLQALRRQFDLIDVGNLGEINRDEFCESVGEKNGPLYDALFALIDRDGNGSIDFNEYVQACATFCMYTKQDIMAFCFNAFDTDGSGAIDDEEFMQLASSVQGGSGAMFPRNFKRALEEFDTNGDGLIDVVEFMELNRRYPLVLYPAFRMQENMQKHMLGRSFWMQMMADKKLAADVDAYKRSHGGVSPPVPLSHKLKRAVCCTSRLDPYRDSSLLLIPPPFPKPVAGAGNRA